MVKCSFPSLCVAMILLSSAAINSCTTANDDTGYYTDPVTGIVYQKIVRIVETPVIETSVKTEQKVVSVPKTVTETRPQVRSVVTPVARQRWQPQVEGRWNPFRQPAIVYHSVPETTWEVQNQLVQHSQTRVDWVAENRTVQVPTRTIRYERKQQIAYEPVGHASQFAAVGQLQPTPQAPESNLPQQVIARLRPMPNLPGDGLTATRDRFQRRGVASNSNRALDRSPHQSSQRTSNLTNQIEHQSGGYAPAAIRPMQSPTSIYPSAGIATLPAAPIFR